jgi:hypothetical protein
VLEVRAVASVFSHRCPFIVQDARSGLANILHRLNGDDHAFTQACAVAACAEIWHLRVFMQTRSDSMSYKLTHHAEAVGFNVFLSGSSHITNGLAQPYFRDGFLQRCFSHVEQFLQLWRQ